MFFQSTSRIVIFATQKTKKLKKRSLSCQTENSLCFKQFAIPTTRLAVFNSPNRVQLSGLLPVKTLFLQRFSQQVSKNSEVSERNSQPILFIFFSFKELKQKTIFNQIVSTLPQPARFWLRI